MSSVVIAAVIFCCFSGGQDVGRAVPVIRVCDGISALPAKTDYAAEIAANRKGKLTVTVTDSEGTPMPGMKLRWRLVERRFHFGCFSNLYNPAVVDKVKGMGCDFTTVHFNWQATEPEEGKFDWERIDFRCNPIGYSENGFLVKAHALVWLHAPVTPDYLKAKSFPEMKKAVRKHVEVLVLHYRDAVDIWNVINEPSASWTNIYAFSDAQIIELIKIACDVVRKRDPSARIIINNGSPIVKFYESGESPLDFLKECAAAGVDYDIVGLQCYYGPYTSRPGEDKATLQDLSDMADAYSELGKEVHITEFSVPSTEVEGRAAWTEKKQADWAEAAYKVFFSKPAVKAITWWNATDRRSFIESGALLREDGKPKKAYKRLNKLITKAWYTSGKGVTDAGGSVGLQGFGGQIRDHDNGTVERAEHHRPILVI